MIRRNLRPRNTHLHTLGTPPSIPCPHCPRHFRSKTGRTRHINAIHHDTVDVSDSHDRNSSPPLVLSGDSSGSRRSYRSQDDEPSFASSDSQDHNSSPPLVLSGDSSESQRSYQSQDDEQSLIASGLPSPIRMPSSSLDHNTNMDVDRPHIDRDYTPTRSDIDSSGSSSSAEDRRQSTAPPEIERTYHTIMNGMWCTLNTLYHRLTQSVCCR
jgi:hypothetical protein